MRPQRARLMPMLARRTRPRSRRTSVRRSPKTSRAFPVSMIPLPPRKRPGGARPPLAVGDVLETATVSRPDR